MVGLLGHIRKNIDYLYLSILIIISASVFTLLLYGLYYWFTTGVIPLTAGIPVPASVSADNLRFFIGGVYVPILVAFSGIVIAHRLKKYASAPIAPPLNGQTLRMSLQGDAYMLESSRPEKDIVECDPAEAESAPLPEQECNPSDYRHCSGCGEANVLTNDYCSRCRAPMAVDPAAKKQEASEVDILEELKNPVNREKLTALLLSAK